MEKFIKVMMLDDLINFIKQNYRKILIILVIHLLLNISIGIVNYPYIDDTSRASTGITGYADSYYRYGSEVLSWGLQGSRHLTDNGLTNHIVTSLILTLTSVLIIYVLKKRNSNVGIGEILASTIVGINPWVLELLSFRFDTPFMTLSILLSIIPFYYFEKSIKLFGITSLVSIFIMCNTYQGSSGIYLALLIILWYLNYVEDKTKNLLLTVSVGVGSYIVGILFFLLEMKLFPSPNPTFGNTTIAPLAIIIKTAIKNAYLYGLTIFNQSASVWKFLIALVFLLIIIKIIFSKISLFKKFLGLILIPTVIVSSYGLYLFLLSSLMLQRPRYAFGFGIVICFLMVSLTRYNNHSKIRTLTNLVTILTIFYFMNFGLGYASVLANQKSQFQSDSTLLQMEISDLVSKGKGQKIHLNYMANNSIIFENSTRNYPLLRYLVPDNRSTYWPNLFWFRIATGSTARVGEIGKGVNLDELQFEKETSNFKIYSKGNEAYFFHK